MFSREPQPAYLAEAYLALCSLLSLASRFGVRSSLSTNLISRGGGAAVIGCIDAQRGNVTSGLPMSLSLASMPGLSAYSAAGSHDALKDAGNQRYRQAAAANSRFQKCNLGENPFSCRLSDRLYIQTDGTYP